MVIDGATLHDLEVLSTSTPRGWTVCGLVDRTKTRAGRECLRQLLATPGRTAEDILALQHAHRMVGADAASYRWAVDRSAPDAVERYLNSNWQLPYDRPGLTRFVEALWRPAWLRQYLLEVAAGQTRIAALLDAARELRERLSAADSTVLQRLGATLSRALSSPDILAVRRLASARFSSARFEFDQLARGKVKRALAALLDCVGMIEAMWSLAAATAEHGWSYPRPGPRLRVTGLRHPFLGRRGVANDLHLQERTRVCFVTGPNMAGKSTFLKAIGIAMLLAHAGCGVPAASMEFPVTATLFSSVQIADNLGAGESLYLAEVRRIRSLAMALHEHGSICAVLDEPFRGTNVHDASEATLAVISRLLEHPGALVFVASHLAEVTPALVDHPHARLLHFSAEVVNERPEFDYHLRDGISTQRLGVILLRQEKVLELLDSVESKTHPSEEMPT